MFQLCFLTDSEGIAAFLFLSEVDVQYIFTFRIAHDQNSFLMIAYSFFYDCLGPIFKTGLQIFKRYTKLAQPHT